MNTKTTYHSTLLGNVKNLIDSRIDPNQSKLINSFVDRIFYHVSLDDLSGRSESNLYSSCLNLWQSVQEFSPKKPLIKVYTPNIKTDGWTSERTIVEVIQNDMPFLVDSVRMLFTKKNITTHFMLHNPIALLHDSKNNIQKIQSVNKDKNSTNITVLFAEIDNLQLAEQKELEKDLHDVLVEVNASVCDWQAMKDKVQTIATDVEKNSYFQKYPEVLDFLNWLRNHNFTLLGYRKYDVKEISGDHVLSPNLTSSLGLMKLSNKTSKDRLLSSLPGKTKQFALDENPLILTKSNSIAKIHRPAHMDYIGIKIFDENEKVIGEHRILGLYTSTVYNQSATLIPIINKKIQKVLEESTFSKGSHAYKGLLNILETHPRDELFESSPQKLLEIGLGVLQMQERDKTKLFLRKDRFGRFFSCFVYVRKDRYNTAFRMASEDILRKTFNSKYKIEFNTFFSESAIARTHFIVRVDNNNLDIDVKNLEENLIEAARKWHDKFATLLTDRYGETKGKQLSEKYRHAFPAGFTDDILPGMAVSDIEQLEALESNDELGILFYKAQEDNALANAVRLKLFQKEHPIHLSDVLPILEHMGLRIIGEKPFLLSPKDDSKRWILDFSMNYVGSGKFDVNANQVRFQEALAQIWDKKLEDDGFNRLVLAAALSGRQASVLRAYAKYMRQIGTSFSQQYIEETLYSYPKITQNLYHLFDERFNPEKEKRDEKKYTKKIEELLEDVASLDDDRIIRRYQELIYATIRTNFYQTKDGELRPAIAFKLKPENISEMPLPRPKFEIFVYSPRIEGVHLRGGKVARGGLRWSDRREDFRTEVLGLVKAQQVKNSVIVPVGAKGGFVCKLLTNKTSREETAKEGQACYKTFIRSLLDVTDNIVDNKTIHPDNVVRHDEDDTYLVVAADKGTATFSDIANSISAEYNFWLGDAFASGGSVGYDHKKMGITARGAWDAVQRHFREIDIDCQKTPFTCVAVGDMAGDVFGNGMLLSKQTKLVAAFNHMHIFIDPNPDVASSYKERKRLFDKVLGWGEYNTSIISSGGGIFLRNLKSIPLSHEIQSLLHTKKTSMNPTELINNILKMQVDLLWNGGIGTYVKASNESDVNVGDRSNDALRITGKELNAKIVGEGGNLGFTQLGRLEYAAHGGRMNTDFTDNVGGVDCSDNEVNIKILLNKIVQEGNLTAKQRDELLYSMTDDISKIVLKNCYRQTQSISVSMGKSPERVKELQRFMHSLEKEDALDRELEYLPTDEQIAERIQEENGFYRSELSVLVSYAKMMLKEQLKNEQIANEEYFSDLLFNNFPQVLQEKFSKEIANHPLRTEIIATRLANLIVDDMGATFAYKMKEETGASFNEIALCYMMSRDVFAGADTDASIVKLDHKIKSNVQYDLLAQMRKILLHSTRWFLRHRDKGCSIVESLKVFRPVFDDLWSHIEKYLMKDEVQEIQEVISRYTNDGVPKEIARKIAYLTPVFSSLDLAQIVQDTGTSILLVADIYFKLGSKLELHWFLEQIANQDVANHWQALAKASFKSELDWQQRALTQVVLKSCHEDCKADEVIDLWMQTFDTEISRWLQMLGEFKTTKTHEFAKFSVALRELMLLSLNCDKTVKK